MKKIHLLSIYCLFLLACSDNKSVFTQDATGIPYELMVVCKESLWKSPAGVALEEVLEVEVPFLPQYEPNFKVMQVAPAHFDGVLKPIRNIIIAEIDPQQYTQGKITYAKDVWASGQLVLYIKAPDKDEFIRIVQSSSEFINNFFVNGELNRTIALYEEKFNSDAFTHIQKELGVEFKIPGELSKSKIGKGFLWFSNDNARGRMDIVAYAVPYDRTEAFSRKRLIEVRDSVMKANIPGSLDKSFMTTSRQVDPAVDTISLKGKFCIRMGGLWEMTGDMMGGPFISHTMLDESQNRIITVEGFVFAPEMNKRNLFRRLQAVLYTLKTGDMKTSNSALDLNASKIEIEKNSK